MAKFTKIIHQNNENFLIKKFIRFFRAKIKNKGKKRFSFVLTGGDSPIKLYKQLSKNKNISLNVISKLAPKVVEGTKRLKEWVESN